MTFAGKAATGELLLPLSVPEADHLIASQPILTENSYQHQPTLTKIADDVAARKIFFVRLSNKIVKINAMLVYYIMKARLKCLKIFSNSRKLKFFI